MGKKFVLYGLLGWCGEVIWTGLGSLMKGDIMLSSFTYGWMFLIYGLAVFLEPIHDKIRHLSILARGGIYGILILMAEFATGSILGFILGACPWNYSDSPLSVYGIIRLDYFFVWFFVGLLFERIRDRLDKIAHIIF